MDYFEINKKSWNRRTGVHFDSEFYDVPGFLDGKSSLNDIEANEIGSVYGKKLLHLQCHFGMDTLSFARKGAIVTGVDISSEAIKRANELKERAKLEARFICSDIYEFGRTASPEFDIVFTSYGTVCWLPDLKRWADVISGSLKKGGTFYMVEFHPIYDIIAGYSYFHKPEPDVETGGTYTENSGDFETECASWTHPLSDVVTSLVEEGIQIEFLHEYPYSPYNCFDGLEERERNKFYLKHSGQDVPLLYSIKGIKN